MLTGALVTLGTVTSAITTAWLIVTGEADGGAAALMFLLSLTLIPIGYGGGLLLAWGIQLLRNVPHAGQTVKDWHDRVMG